MADKTPPPFETCVLEDGIVRGDSVITKVTLRKPKAGELRNTNLHNLMNLDVGTLITLLPRICDPVVTEADVEALSPLDLATLGAVVIGFFMSAAQRQAIPTQH